MKLALAACLLLSGCTGPPAPPPPPLELIGVLHDDIALNRPHDVELQGDVAYVPGKGGSVALIDISNPTAPRLLSSLTGGEEMEDAETVLPMGDVLLLGTRDFLAVDVRDPRRPTILKRISDRTRIDKINGMALVGSHVLTANKTGWVTVFDVADPADPRLVDALDTRIHGGLDKPHDIAAFGDRIVVVNAARVSKAALQIYRVRDPATGSLLPAAEWVVEGAVGTGDQLRWALGGANRVTARPPWVFAGAFVNDRVAAFDISNPARPVQAANMPCCDIDATGMTLAGNVLFVSGGECVEAIDISDPAQPVSLAQYRAGELFPTRRIELGGAIRYDNGHDLVYRDGYLYVTAQNDNRFGILKVNDPRILELARQPVGAFDTPAPNSLN